MGGLAFPGLDQAIAIQENAPPALNNPGGLIVTPWSELRGATGVPNSKATFPTPEAGASALDQLVANYANRGDTLQQMFDAWAPAGEGNNDPIAYANSVASRLGTTPTAPVSSLAGVAAPTESVAAPASASTSSSFFGISASRIAAFLGGLICIAGAIFLYGSAKVAPVVIGAVRGRATGAIRGAVSG
jgi:hypothetical protein